MSNNIASPANLEFSIDGGVTWFPTGLGTSANAQNFELPSGLLRMSSGGGGSMNTYAALI